MKALDAINKDVKDDSLKLSQFTINPAYAKKWQVNLHDFVILSRNNQPIRNTLYRLGGVNYPSLANDKYFMLLKQVEAFYDASITKHTGSRPEHLAQCWTIIDKFGEEKLQFKEFEMPYLVKNSILYSLDGEYFNIETKESYGSGNVIESNDYVFIGDYSKNIVKRINKLNGGVKLYN